MSLRYALLALLGRRRGARLPAGEAVHRPAGAVLASERRAGLPAAARPRAPRLVVRGATRPAARRGAPALPPHPARRARAAHLARRAGRAGRPRCATRSSCASWPPSATARTRSGPRSTARRRSTAAISPSSSEQGAPRRRVDDRRLAHEAALAHAEAQPALAGALPARCSRAPPGPTSPDGARDRQRHLPAASLVLARADHQLVHAGRRRLRRAGTRRRAPRRPAVIVGARGLSIAELHPALDGGAAAAPGSRPAAKSVPPTLWMSIVITRTPCARHLRAQRPRERHAPPPSTPRRRRSTATRPRPTPSP